MKRYKITYCNDFTEPSLYVKDEIVRHMSIDQYVVEDAESCIQTVKDFLDVPDKELTVEDIYMQFSSPSSRLEESKAIQICNFYNGRLAIYKKFLEDFKESSYLKYDIPMEHNSFSIEDDVTMQNNAYLSIEETTEDIYSK